SSRVAERLSQIYPGDLASVCFSQRSCWTTQTTPDVKNMRAGVQIHFRAQFECRFPAADVKLVNCDKISGRLLVKIFLVAPQLLSDCIGQFEVFTIMACYAVSHRPRLWGRRIHPRIAASETRTILALLPPRRRLSVAAARGRWNTAGE